MDRRDGFDHQDQDCETGSPGDMRYMGDIACFQGYKRSGHVPIIEDKKTTLIPRCGPDHLSCEITRNAVP